MIYRVKPGQVSYGEAVGILLLENYVPYIPGDVANATSYTFPVRFKRVPGFSVKRVFAHDMTIADELAAAARELEAEGVRVITGDCGFMALYQERIRRSVSLPVVLSSLSQIPFLRTMLKSGKKIGIITANAGSLDNTVFFGAGVSPGDDMAIAGLEGCSRFVSAVFREEGVLDSDKVCREVTETALSLISAHPETELLLLECSLLPPYSAAVAEATGLPVFDYLTMIRQLHDAVVPHRYSGYM